jgi:hypothetical protein
MARKPSARVTLNRKNLTRLHAAFADGIEEVLRTFVETAKPPDATPFGEGLVTRGGWLVYDGSKKVAGGSLEGIQPNKPRSFRVRGTAGIQGIAGFGFPARFQEAGTVHQPARPFGTPAAIQTENVSLEIMRDAVGPLVRRG